MGRVTYVLAVGEASDAGPPVGVGWQVFASWAQKNVDAVLVNFYPHVEPRIVAGMDLSRAVRSPFPDPQSRLDGLRIDVSETGAERLLLCLRCDPEDGVTHLFCYRHQDVVAELEVNDGMNFVLLHVGQEQAVMLAALHPDPAENVEICSEWRDVIAMLVGDEEEWAAIGAQARE